MRTLFFLWAIPTSLIGLWYGLSANNLHFGTRIFSRELHDLVFNLYGNMLGIAPEALPAMLAKTIAFDSAIVLSIVAYRMRKSWWPTVSQMFRSDAPVVGQGSSAE